jgi:peptide methionine sulfoxide reductase MsrA
MTRTNEMTDPQARAKHRTNAQTAELCLQSAEDYHQQYLYKVPHGYCPDHSTGLTCPVGLIKAE